MTSCIYHDDKPAFETLRRLLQRHKVLSRPLSKRLAMAVCSCRKKRTAHLEISDEDHKRMKENIQFHFNQRNEKTDIPMTSFQPLINIFRSKVADKSEKYLIYIIHKALEGNFELLEGERRANTKIRIKKIQDELNGEKENPSSSGFLGSTALRDAAQWTQETRMNENEAKPDEKSYKMTIRQIRFMVRKRKRKMPIFENIVIPIHGNNMHLLTKQTGRELKRVAQRFRCYIEINWAEINENIYAGIPTSSLKVWCRTQESMESVKRYFRELMKTKDFVNHSVIGNEYKYIKDVTRDWQRQLKVNYCLTDHFTEKVLDRKRPKNRYVNSRQRVKSLPSALGIALCERCQQSYRDALVNDRPCFFHPGSMEETDDGRKWSCCDAIVEECPLAEEHHCTGCWKGSHIWNLSPVVTTPGGDCRTMFNRPKHKLKWAVVGYAKAF